MDLTNREAALLFWIVLPVVVVLARDKDGSVKKALRGLAQAFLNRYILAIFSWAMLWIVLSIQGLAWLGLWSLDNLKGTVIWVVTFAMVTVFEVNRITDEASYRAKTLKDVVNATVVVAYFAEMYSFSLPVELVITPLLLFFSLMAAVSERKPDNKLVYGFSQGVLIVAGLTFLAYSAYRAAQDVGTFATIANVKEFLIPVALSLAFLPFLYAMIVLLTYERTATVLGISLKDPGLTRYAMWQAVLRFGLNLNGLRRWKRSVLIAQARNRDAIRALIAEVKRIQRLERAPPPVPAALGWSPFAAAGFLRAAGLGDGDYHRLFDDHWNATSALLKLSDSALADTLGYYIEGDATAAKRLELCLTVWDGAQPQASIARFGEVCALLLKAAAVPLAEDLHCQGDLDVTVGERRLRMKTDPLGEGFTLTFTVDHSPEYRSPLDRARSD